ncbi:MAG: T9SS type A sorting domain-containing protein [Bacteroidetes bacterium]|nr:T9SS type A sorting domain-containing protein [Bacteroidota bacterium]
MKNLLTVILLLVAPAAFSQVITTNPAFPTETGSVTITFYADRGTAGLKGFTGDVYAHTGVITDKSTSDTDWKYVKTNWGTNTPETKLTRTATDKYTLTISNPRTYYGVASGDKIKKLAFVFRSATSPWKEGKDTGGKDILQTIFEGDLNVIFNKPANASFVAKNSAVDVEAIAAIAGGSVDKIVLYVNGSLNTEVMNDTLKTSVTASADGKTVLMAVAHAGSGTDTAYTSFIVVPPVADSPVPAGIKPGINYYNDDPTKVTLALFAPKKDHVFVIGDFSNWEPDPAYFMNRYSVSADSVMWWVTITGLEAGKEYGFQYLVNGSLRIADPYTEKVLSPDDTWIPSVTYPNLKPYPTGKTNFPVSVFQTNEEEYEWQVTDFVKPKKEDLVIYELLLRDFIARHDYDTLIDSLAYLKRLGINAVQLMPIQEFEGNESWGYNPAFYFAPDKYYGTKNDLKRFIDECHKIGLAVIIDVVYNHSFGQSSMVRLYATGDYGPPSADNYWFNTVARHPYNVGYDMNHESVHTKYLLDRANKHWIQEYKVDGYRYDLSKGFTQVNSGDNVGLWGNYDQSRVDILKRMYDRVRDYDSEAYLILEHLGDNSEEKVLANHGFMLWGNMNKNFNEGTMGYHDQSKSDLSWAYYGTRTWTVPHVVTYMESHDEERLMYKNLQYGNSSGGYNIKTLATSIDRIKLAATFLFSIPGPKMIWQFGELGYDISIDFNGRVGNKPIKWEYLTDTNRRKLYDTFSELIRLKIEEPAFETNNVSLNVGGAMKRINLYHADMDVVVLGNFGVTTADINPNFSKTGWWYSFFTADSVEISNTTGNLSLAAGEYRIYTTKRLWTPKTFTSVDDKPGVAGSFELEQNYPNPFNPSTTIRFNLPVSGKVRLTVYDVTGREVAELINGDRPAGTNTVVWSARDRSGAPVSSGLYFYQLSGNGFNQTRKMMLIK